MFTFLAIRVLFTLLALAIFWAIASLKIVGPAEMAVKVYFGTPVAVCDSGFRFVPWCFGLTYLVRYPKKVYNLEYDGIEVITIEGEYPLGSGRIFGATKVKINAAEYLNFPRPETLLEPGENTHPLIKILRAGVPQDDAGLQAWTKEAVESAVRLACGQVTWKQAAEDISAINGEVGRIFKYKNGALIRAGFRGPGIKLAVSKIILPPEVERALTKPEETRLEAEAAVKDAEAQATDRLGTVLWGIAISEGIDISVVRDRVKTDEGLRDKLLAYSMALHADIEKADRNAYYKLDSSGNPFLDVVTLWRKMTSGGGGGGGDAKRDRDDSGKGKKGGKKPDSKRKKGIEGITDNDPLADEEDDEDEEEEEKNKGE